MRTQTRYLIKFKQGDLACLRERILTNLSREHFAVLPGKTHRIEGSTIVADAILSRYDDLLEQQLMHWASRRHSGKTRDWLLARYWHATRERKRVFATPDGVQLRAYRQARILKGEGKQT